MNIEKPSGHAPSSRRKEHDNLSSVRPTLDHLVAVVCSDIANRVRLGRPLPVRGMR